MEREQEVVHVHGLLGHLDSLELRFDPQHTSVGSRFIHDKVSYKVVKRIDQDVTHPILYVIALDIFI